MKEQLQKLRKMRNLTQEEMADILEVSLSSYQKYERDAIMPSYDTLIKLADFYGVTTDYLLGRNTEDQSAVEKLAGEFNMTALEKEILEGYVNLPKEMRGDLMEFLRKAVENVMEENEKPAPDIMAYTANMAAGTGAEGMTEKKIKEMEAFGKLVSDYENKSE